jgi:hypothetical protein
MRFEDPAVISMKIIVLRLVAYRQVPLPIKVQDVAFQKTTVVLGKLGSCPGQIN